MAIRDFVQEGLAAQVIPLSLGVQGAFGAAWWPGILKGLRDCVCPQKLYELTKSYFTQRTATLSTNYLRTEKEISRLIPRFRIVAQASGIYNITRYWK
jgi:hypothetical protein